ncbi:MAG: hypothetical protein QOH59_3048 [Gemmatimonadales bacterium]|jgi:hypothetical protein|nr:hypothetical protein [Gemmatimonadales bacterium]
MTLLGSTLRMGVVALLLAADGPAPVPSAFRFEPGARPELHRLWDASLSAKAERVACLAGSIDSDTVRISRVLPLEVGASDSLGVSAGASLDTCGPPSWRGTVHTHVALRDGRQPYSLFSGADRGIMMLWWRRWQEDGIFCLLYSAEEVICEIEGPRGAVLFPRSHY